MPFRPCPIFFNLPYGPTQLPGEPSNIVALGGAKAEMTTSSGAIYYTKNAGMNWSAQVQGPTMFVCFAVDKKMLCFGCLELPSNRKHSIHLLEETLANCAEGPALPLLSSFAITLVSQHIERSRRRWTPH